MATMTDALNLARQYRPEITEANFLTWSNALWEELTRTSAWRTTSLDISLTAGTREYALASSVGAITQVEYLQSANSRSVLTILNTDEQDGYAVPWRSEAVQAIPTRYYVVSVPLSTGTSRYNIGFDPIPPTTTSGSYPVARIYYSNYTAMVIGDAIPIGASMFLFATHAAYQMMVPGPEGERFREEYMRMKREALMGLRRATHQKTRMVPNIQTPRAK